MRISVIAAMDRNRVIGRENQLPWHLPADLKWFKKNTIGKTIVMGRKTFESIGRPLPGRTNIVLSRDENFSAEGCLVVHTIEEVFQEVDNEDEIMIIGGAQLFKQLISRANRLYITRIDAEFDGDSYFPALESEEWRVVLRDEIASSEVNPYGLQFLIVDRVHPANALP
jgi:dihydrofolate reductase